MRDALPRDSLAGALASSPESRRRHWDRCAQPRQQRAALDEGMAPLRADGDVFANHEADIPCPGRGAAFLRRSADPGSFQTRSVEWSRFCEAVLHTASRPGHEWPHPLLARIIEEPLAEHAIAVPFLHGDFVGVMRRAVMRGQSRGGRPQLQIIRKTS
jgi:hypothetical protein